MTIRTRTMAIIVAIWLVSATAVAWSISIAMQPEQPPATAEPDGPEWKVYPGPAPANLLPATVSDDVDIQVVSGVQDPIACAQDGATITSPLGMTAIAFASKEDLLRVLRELPPGAITAVGYAGRDGDFHMLSEDDLQPRIVTVYKGTGDIQSALPPCGSNTIPVPVIP